MLASLKELVPEVVAGRCILFLGSGSTIACESSSGGGVTGDGLAKEIIKAMGEDPNDFKASLMEASEYLEALSPQHRNALDDFIYSRLHDLQPTIGHLLLTLFPWRAIVTTNYNRAVEAGFDVATSRGMTRFTCMPVRTDQELV